MTSRHYHITSESELAARLARDFPGFRTKPHGELPLYEELVAQVQSGEKVTTIRFERNTIRFPSTSRLRLMATSPSDASLREPVGSIDIRDFEVKLFRDLTELDARRDGCRSLGELRSLLTQIFGDIPRDHPISIYSFGDVHLDRMLGAATHRR